MTRRDDRLAGLTLVEVLIAVFILAVGVLVAAGLQTSGLRATRVAQGVQDVHAEARSEMEAWRVRLETSVHTEPATGSCMTSATDCTIEIDPCFVSGGDLDCTSASLAAADVAAQALSVTVSNDDRSVTLRSVVLRETP